MTNNDNHIQKEKPMPKPSNEIDMQALTTFPYISSDYLSDRVRNKFRSFDYVYDENGEVVKDGEGLPRIQVTRDYWANMELFTQDLRLGNLNKDEAEAVRYHVDLAEDILTTLPESFNKPALIALERAISIVETSQSKGGFLRRMFNTFFSHSSTKDEAPAKRSFFGLGKKNNME